MTDLVDELRIIARDGGRLSTDDRAKIAEAAEEFERTQRDLFSARAQLIEANARRIALTEQIIEDRRAAAAKKQEAQTVTMSFGPFAAPLNWAGWGT